jgi:hypothetical protein
MKRRRTSAPLLDGPSRGWEYRSSDEGVISDDEEWTCEDGGAVDQDDATEDAHASPETVPSASAGTEYKRANSLLHEVHALHQHRMTFTTSELSLHHPEPPSSKYALSERLRMPHHDTPLHNSSASDMGARETSISMDEVRCVKERYEDSNK